MESGCYYLNHVIQETFRIGKVWGFFAFVILLVIAIPCQSVLVEGWPACCLSSVQFVSISTVAVVLGTCHVAASGNVLLLGAAG